MITRRNLMAAGALLPFARPAIAQERYPARQVTVINPFAAGGQTDPIGRIVNNHLQKTTGHPFLLENKVGAGSTLGGQYVVRAAPDGYTLLLGTSSTFSIAPYVYRPQPYDPLTDLAPITPLIAAPSILVASGPSGFKTLDDVIKAAHKDPGKITIASPGLGSLPHIFAEFLASLAGIKLTHVPYRGGGPAMNDLVSGQVDLFFEVVSNVVQHVDAGKITALMSTGEKRSAMLPDTPSAIEVGYPKMKLNVWTGLAAPAHTPPTIIELLDKEANRALQLPETKTFLDKTGNAPIGGGPGAMSEMIRSDIALYRKIISDNNIAVN